MQVHRKIPNWWLAGQLSKYYLWMRKLCQKWVIITAAYMWVDKSRSSGRSLYIPSKNAVVVPVGCSNLLGMFS